MQTTLFGQVPYVWTNYIEFLISVWQLENKFHYLDLHAIESPKPNKVGISNA